MIFESLGLQLVLVPPPLVAEWILILFDVRPLKQVGLDELYNTLNRDIWKCVRPLPSNA